MKDKPASGTLWAPWRAEYILGDKEDGCIFCKRIDAGDDRESLILYSGSSCFVIMNRYPYNSGHVMVVPNRHIGKVQELNSEENLEIMPMIQKTTDVLERVMTPNGFNIGMNVGAASGAGVADHLHIHIIPRWNGDTNFMPVIGNTRIISEALYATYDKLKIEFDKLAE